MDIVQRFINYTKINTTTVVNAGKMPSSDNQWELAKLLEKELKEMGVSDVKINDKSILIAKIPSNTTKKCPVIGFCAHMDTSSDHKTDTKAQVLKYTGQDLLLNKEKGIYLKKSENPQLDNYLNDDIIVTDGTSLLGGDNKSAIAEVMDAVQNIMKNKPEHGEIRILFVPDEEQGLLGARATDVKEFGADFAYTLDLDGYGSVVSENWNATSCEIIFHGMPAHPMNAKGRLKNSLLYAHKFISMLPQGEAPEYTENKEGFYGVNNIEGNVLRTRLVINIRDFFEESFNKREKNLRDLVDYFNKVYGAGTVEITTKAGYRNVAPYLQGDKKYVMDLAKQAMKNIGVEPKESIMRGGYDGSVLSEKGVPTPNLFCGVYNFHSIYEFLPVSSLKKASALVEELIKLTVNVPKK